MNCTAYTAGCTWTFSLHLLCLGVTTCRGNAVEEVSGVENVVAAVGREPPPALIVVVGTEPLRNKGVWTQLIDLLRGGATLIVIGVAEMPVDASRFNRFFARAGV